MRFAIGVSYCGAGLEGWQSQPSGNTVQDHLERALSEIGGEPIAHTAAGRTDAGVHASAQVAHFETHAARPESAWVRGANSLLPSGIAIQWAAPVAEDFHARYSAVSRTYLYVLYNHAVRPALLAGRAGWFHLPLDIEKMREGARCLVGEHDFSSFRSAECQAKSPVRVMHAATIRASGAYVLFDFTANAFLHHMVRNLVGCRNALAVKAKRTYAPPTRSCTTWYGPWSPAWSTAPRARLRLAASPSSSTRAIAGSPHRPSR